MNCPNCNAKLEENVVFCGNCGTKITNNQNTNEIAEQKDLRSSKKKNIFIILIILVLIIGIAITTIFFLNKSKIFEDPFEDIDSLMVMTTFDSQKGFEEKEDFLSSIKRDLEIGLITDDEYIMQMAYLLYEPEKLNSEYSTLDYGSFNLSTLLDQFSNKLDVLSIDTIKYVYAKYVLSDIQWADDDSDTIKPANILKNDYNIRKLAKDNSDTGKLDSVKLSQNGNFLIYYSKNGNTAITEDKADLIATTLENMVSEYSNKYKLNYKYEAKLSETSNMGKLQEVLSFGLFEQATKHASRLLKDNNIDTKYLETAMPVFVIDTNVSETRELGFYVPPLLDSKMEELVIKLINVFNDSITTNCIATTYAFPFFVINYDLSNFDDIKTISAHELFHHYQKYICGDGNYKDCVSDDFTVETTANLAASQIIQVNNTNTEINHHAAGYINHVEYSIDKLGASDDSSGNGYEAFVFAKNYTEVVPDGLNIMFKSSKYNNPLNYLYNNSSGKYKEALLLTAKRNLTLDYSNKLFIGTTRSGSIVYPPNHIRIYDDSSGDETINYSSMHYYYIDPSDFEKTSQLSFNTDSANLTLLLFILENNSYKHIYTHELNNEFVININDFNNYKEIAVAIVNSSIDKTAAYDYAVDSTGPKEATVTAKSLGVETLESIVNNASIVDCYKIENSGEYITLLQIKLLFNKKNKINDMYFKSTIRIKQYDPDNQIFALTQKLVSGMIYIMKNAYEEQFKYFNIITEEGTDKYSLTFRVTKKFYEALKNGLEISAEEKYDIVKEFQADGYVCEFPK